MSDDSFDIPDIPDVPGEDSGGQRRGNDGGGSRRRWPWLLAGVLLGVAGILLIPRYLGPYLPDFLGFDREVIRGQVVASERQDDRLLLTVDSERGALLVTYRDRIDEIRLLVADGDSVVLRAREFRPFLEGPELVGVRKGRWGGPDAAGAAADPDSVSRQRSGGGGDDDTDTSGVEPTRPDSTRPDTTSPDTTGGAAGADGDARVR